MLQPARRKYRKEQKGRNTGLATRGAKVSFGEYGLKAIGRGRLDRTADRSCPSCHDTSHQARWSYLDSHLPG
jgi:ribosomal protein L16/L10AE